MKYLLPILLSISLFACTGNDNEQEAKLQGRWDCVYVEQVGEEIDPSGIRFEFQRTKYRYYTGGKLWEEGNFWVAGNKLITEGPEVMKKSVEIAQLANDSLVLGMNDRGRTMTMIFEKSPDRPETW